MAKGGILPVAEIGILYLTIYTPLLRYDKHKPLNRRAHSMGYKKKMRSHKKTIFSPLSVDSIPRSG